MLLVLIHLYRNIKEVFIETLNSDVLENKRYNSFYFNSLEFLYVERNYFKDYGGVMFEVL